MSDAITWTELTDYFPDTLPIKINTEVLTSAMEYGLKHNCSVLAFVVGTKPCFNKVYGALQACKKKGIPYFVINANQHYDANLTFMLDEFNFSNDVAVNLQIRGDLVQKSGELVFKVSRFARWIFSNWSSVPVVPVVNGDTILCPLASMAWMFSRSERGIHLEAGLRSMAPAIFDQLPLDISLADFMYEQRNKDWLIKRSDPFPEQWGTFTASAACELYYAPLELNKSHLVREGYSPDKIFVIGSTIIDAIETKLREKKSTNIFAEYPQLAEGKWIRFDIHRRENMRADRFMVLFALLENLVMVGFNVQFVLMNSTKEAISRLGLSRRLEKLQKNSHLLVTEVWPSFADVVTFYQSPSFWVALTDSGGVQEDLHILNKPCVTLRFSTDRPETVNQQHGNILVPPVSESFMTRIIIELLNDKPAMESLKNEKCLYGENVGEAFATALRPYIFTGFDNIA